MPILMKHVYYEEKNTSTTSKAKREQFCRKYSDAEREKAYKKLKLAADNFLITLPFFGYILTRQKLVEASQWIPTAGVDGRNFYYNIGFINSLSVPKVQFLLCHEILHLIYGHLLRTNYPSGLPRIHKLFNIANDYIVNYDSLHVLKSVGGEYEIPDGCFMNEHRFNGFISEEIYEELIKDIKAKIMKDRKEAAKKAKEEAEKAKEKGNDSESSDNCNDESDDTHNNDESNNESNDDKSENQDEENSDEEGSNAFSDDDFEISTDITNEDIERAIDELYPDGTFDEHMDLSGNTKETENGRENNVQENSDGTYCATEKPDLSKDAIDRRMEAFKGDILIAKTLLSPKDMAGMGCLPGNALRVIRELEEPVFNWRRYIKKYVLGLKKRRLSWTTPKRRSNSKTIILPGKQKEKVYKIHVSLDTSGSISEDDLRDFLSEVYGAARQLRDVEITIWTFDTSIYNEQKYTKQNISRIREYKIYGNGGTDFYQNWVYMKENNIKPDLFIMFTDGGYIGEPGIKGYCETLYVIHGKHRQLQDIPKAYGKTIYYERHKRDS